MDPDLAIGLGFVGLFVFIPFLIVTLRRSALFWLPAAGLIAFAVAVLASLEPAGHGAEGAMTAAGNGIAILFGMFLFGYAALALVIGSVARSRYLRMLAPAQRQLPALPVATVVAGTSER